MSMTALDPHTKSRIIIHTDVDFFYGQVEQLRNPSIRNLPFAIQQKHILVTSNYLARKCGIKKLELVATACQKCPELVIINGEDLDRYRAASKRIFNLVRDEIVWNQQVERLGMDELWIDVTDMIDHHIQTLDEKMENNRELSMAGKHWFDLANPSHSETGTSSDNDDPHQKNKGFWYDLSDFVPGHHLYTYPSSSSFPSQVQLPHPIKRRMEIASHLAAYIRSRIQTTLGFTTSAGISSSKLLSKLSSELHKPDDQTTLYDTAVFASTYGSDNLKNHLSFMAHVQVRKLYGFGYRSLKILYEQLKILGWDGKLITPGSSSRKRKHDALGNENSKEHKLDRLGRHVKDENGREIEIEIDKDKSHATALLKNDDTLEEEFGNEDYKPVSKEKEHFLASQEEGLDVYTVVHMTRHDPSYFTKWYGDTLGSALWSKCLGIDPNPVVPTNPIPSTISIEDSFPRCNTASDLFSRMEGLVAELILRMENELICPPAAVDNTSGKLPSLEQSNQPHSPTADPARQGLQLNSLITASPTWLRYPRTLRLTLRFRSSKPTENLYTWQDNKRESRSCHLPVEVFNTEISIQERAALLTKRSLTGLARKLIMARPSHSSDSQSQHATSSTSTGTGTSTAAAQWDVSLINVAVTNLETEKPSMSSIMGYFTESTSEADKRPDNKASGKLLHPTLHSPLPPPNKISVTLSEQIPAGVDPGVWDALPENIKEEIIREAYHRHAETTNRTTTLSSDPIVKQEQADIHEDKTEVKLQVDGDIQLENEIVNATHEEFDEESNIEGEANNGEEGEEGEEDDDEEDDDDDPMRNSVTMYKCPDCHTSLPQFCVEAHILFHAKQNQENAVL